MSRGFIPLSESRPAPGEYAVVQVDWHDADGDWYETSWMLMRGGEDGALTDKDGNPPDLADRRSWREEAPVGVPVAWRHCDPPKEKEKEPPPPSAWEGPMPVLEMRPCGRDTEGYRRWHVHGELASVLGSDYCEPADIASCPYSLPGLDRGEPSGMLHIDAVVPVRMEGTDRPCEGYFWTRGHTTEELDGKPAMSWDQGGMVVLADVEEDRESARKLYEDRHGM